MLNVPALRHRDFLAFWGGILFSLSGYYMGLVVRGWVVNELTHSPVWLGATYAAGGVAEIVLAPVAGVVIDRFDRKRILVVTQALHALNALGLAAALYTGIASIHLVVLFAFFHGAIATFDWTVRLTLVPNLVPGEALDSAVALSSGAWIMAGILGPSMSGFLLPRFGAAGCFFVVGLCFIPITALALSLKPVPPPARSKGEPWYRSSLEGYRYIFGHKLLRALLVLEALPIILGVPYASLLPLFAEKLRPGMAADGRVLGWLHASAGVGALVGVLSVALARRFPNRGLLLSLTGVLFGLALVAFGGVRSLSLALVLLVSAGCVEALFGTLNATLIQTTAEEGYRGRVMSIYNFIWGLTPLGGMSLGLLASRFGPEAAVKVHGGVVAAAVVLVVALYPQVRGMR